MLGAPGRVGLLTTDRLLEYDPNERPAQVGMLPLRCEQSVGPSADDRPGLLLE